MTAHRPPPVPGAPVEDRLVDLEERLTHQDRLLQNLSDVVYTLSQQIERLVEQLDEAEARAANATLRDGSPADERPPHY